MDSAKKSTNPFAFAARILAAAALISGFAFISAGTLSAEDLSDNATCLECHADERPLGALDVPGAEVHNDDGSFIVEDHEMWSCTDCHVDIEEIPHKEGVDRTVDCTACHEETPQD